ncbi:acyltransferase family protein [Aureimonas psammosilenae]|uniref:acyltransferase family protein n=1 Tax=Aureimonas psammosilenae TaxID=2495496 RepID=UPI00186A1B83|nr:acyltransferase [Aureimonas psammosilenae]
MIVSNEGAEVSAHRLALAHSEAVSAWLDAIRWLAALGVLLTHVQNRLLLRVSEVPDASTLHIAFAFLSGFGRQAVLTFFVLSGYLVGGGCIRSLRRQSFDPEDYAFKRLTRLTVVFVPALVVTFLINSFLIRHGDGLMDPDFRQNMLEGSGAANFVCNLVYMQTALCPTYGGNGSLWSLFNEFWYYAVAGLLACAVKFSDYRLAILGVGLLVGLTAIQIEHNLIIFFVLWAMGAGAAAWPDFKRHVPKRLAFVVYAGAFLSDRVLFREAFNADHPYLRITADYVIALTLCVFLISLRDGRSGRFFPPGRPKTHQELAAFSFSLYCLNVPFINLFATLSEKWFGIGWQENPALTPSVWISVVACIVATVVLSFAFSLVTERQMPALRRHLDRRLA